MASALALTLGRSREQHTREITNITWTIFSEEIFYEPKIGFKSETRFDWLANKVVSINRYAAGPPGEQFRAAGLTKPGCYHLPGEKNEKSMLRT